MRGGELYREQEKAKGGDHGGRKPKDGRTLRRSKLTQTKTLEQLGLSKQQSSRWQELAQNPKAVERYLKEEGCPEHRRGARRCAPATQAIARTSSHR